MVRQDAPYLTEASKKFLSWYIQSVFVRHGRG